MIEHLPGNLFMPTERYHVRETDSTFGIRPLTEKKEECENRSRRQISTSRAPRSARILIASDGVSTEGAVNLVPGRRSKMRKLVKLASDFQSSFGGSPEWTIPDHRRDVSDTRGG